MDQLEKKQLFKLLSQTIPINTIQEQNLTNASYTKSDLLSLIDSMYNDLKKQGYSLTEIKKKFSTVEPFKENINIVIEYFEQLEEKQNDKL